MLNSHSFFELNLFAVIKLSNFVDILLFFRKCVVFEKGNNVIADVFFLFSTQYNRMLNE